MAHLPGRDVREAGQTLSVPRWCKIQGEIRVQMRNRVLMQAAAAVSPTKT